MPWGMSCLFPPVSETSPLGTWEIPSFCHWLCPEVFYSLKPFSPKEVFYS